MGGENGKRASRVCREQMTSRVYIIIIIVIVIIIVIIIESKKRDVWFLWKPIYFVTFTRGPLFDDRVLRHGKIHDFLPQRSMA